MRIVSTCLAGVKCRYDGTASPCPAVMKMVESGEGIPVCPEQLGDLPTPRPPAEIKDGRVLTKDGQDVTEAFEKGVAIGLDIAKRAKTKEAILKSKSPSCGCGRIYDGSFSGTLKKGDGVFAQFLKKQDIRVYSEENLE